MKKIAIVLHGLGANGIDTLFANLSKKWDYNNFEITYLLAVDEGAEQFWENEVKANGVKVIHLHDLDRKRLLKWPHTLKKALVQYGPFDVIHVNMDMLNGINLIVAKKVGIPIRVCHAHNASSKNADSKIKQIYIAIMRKIMRKYATSYVACSDKAGKYFFPECDFEIVFNGINLEKYMRKLDKINVYGGGDWFTTVGRFSSQKNPFFLLDVFNEITRLLPDARMKWIGTGEMLQSVKERADEYGILNKIEFMGVRNDVNEILKKCNYFLLPSLYEGLSLALAEAQAADLDCFVSDTVSKMSDCGKCMFIPLEKSASEWADIIVSYINGNERMQVKTKLLAQFDIAQTAKKFEKMYCKQKEIH